MRKIPTLFLRDPKDRSRLLPTVTPGCEWVLQGEGQATRKYDGTCVKVDKSGAWWARREVKPGKEAPLNWVLEQHDDVTGKGVGWEPIEQSSFYKVFCEAHTNWYGARGDVQPSPGTYELCGPKINGNPEGFHEHILVPHGTTRIHDIFPEDLTFEGLRSLLTCGSYPSLHWEGIVWHHPDGRMAKLKVRDFA